MNIQLPTGNTISVSAYEYYFLLKEDEVQFFFQSCIADDLGTYIDNPFSNRSHSSKLEVDEEEDIKDE